jgi:hypothetical protein
LLNSLDALLSHLLATRVKLLRAGTPPSVLDEQIGFRPPDVDWRTDVDDLTPRRALNVYLAEVRENRTLRSNERIRHTTNGVVTEEPAPVAVDCHYLITAWSPADESAGRTEDEHALLGEVLEVLTAMQALVPRRVFAPASLPIGFPDLWTDAALPLTVAPPEGFQRLPDFWNTMAGRMHPWKPVVVAIVTVPVKQAESLTGPPVTTATATMGTNGSLDTLVAIGGTLFTTAAGARQAVAGVPVGIETPAGERVASGHSDAEGRFRLGCFGPGQYRLHAAVAGFQPASRDVEVPSASGEYDLELS